MVIGAATLELHLPGVQSLKAKRSILRGLTARLQSTFNVACAEVDLHDMWQSASVGLVVVTTSSPHAQDMLDKISDWIEHHRPDVEIVGMSVEVFHWDANG